MADEEKSHTPPPEPENMVRWDPEAVPYEKNYLCVYLRELIDNPPWEDNEEERRGKD